MPLVTLIVITYNQEDYIGKAIESAFGQTYGPLEVIISDDCSTDSTYDLILDKAARYTGPHTVRIVRNEKNVGFVTNLNNALAHAHGQIITWLAGDDIAVPERTETFVSMIHGQSGVVAAHSAVLEIDKQGKPLRVRTHSKDARNLPLEKVLENAISLVTQSSAFSRVLLDRFGPFSSCLTNEGKAMAFRVAVTGRIRYAEKPLTKYRIGSGVSTYAGRDVQQIKRNEPIKVIDWYLSAYKQMLADLKMVEVSAATQSMRALILKRIRFYGNLLEINLGRGLVVPLVSNLVLRPTDLRSLRAVLRRIAPTVLYRHLRGAL